MDEKFDVYDAHLAHIGEIPISPQQRRLLHEGGTITVSYHTPRMLRSVLGDRNGSFALIEAGGRVFVSDPGAEEVKRYITLQADIERAMRDPDQWTDPDAESNRAIR